MKRNKTKTVSSNRRDGAWLANRNATRRPKAFNITLARDEQGQFHAVGGQSLVAVRENGHSAKWGRVNTRALVRAINQTGIKSL